MQGVEIKKKLLIHQRILFLWYFLFHFARVYSCLGPCQISMEVFNENNNRLKIINYCRKEFLRCLTGP